MLNDEENFLGGSLLIAFFGWQDSPHVFFSGESLLIALRVAAHLPRRVSTSEASLYS